MSLKHAILGFLSIEPMSGYDLKKAFDQSVRHFWPANQSQIYRTLAELDTLGLVDKQVVRREDRLDMKVYHIRPAGRAELHRWLSTPLPTDDTREPVLIQVFFAGGLSDAELLTLLQYYLVEVDGALAILTAIHTALAAQPDPSAAARSTFLRGLTIEYGVAANTAIKEWLQSAIERVATGGYAPTGQPAPQVDPD